MCLSGELGSGKTTSVKAIAKCLGMAQEVTSPTFVIMKHYPLPEAIRGIKEIVHMDAYRLHGAPDAESVGLSELLERDDALILIEWPENIENILPAERKTIKFSHQEGDVREIITNF